MNNNPRKVLSFKIELRLKTNPALQLKITKHARKLIFEKGELQ